MKEVAVAFPNDEATGEVLASRLRAAGIWARVDRGLWGTWQAGTPGQISVVTDGRLAKRARAVLGAAEGGVPAGTLAPRLAIAMIVATLALGAVAIAGSVFR